MVTPSRCRLPCHRNADKQGNQLLIPAQVHSILRCTFYQWYISIIYTYLSSRDGQTCEARPQRQLVVNPQHAKQIDNLDE